MTTIQHPIMTSELVKVMWDTKIKRSTSWTTCGSHAESLKFSEISD